MANLPPIDMNLGRLEPRFPGDPERFRRSRQMLEALAENFDGSHDYAYSWGYIIFRTVYGPGTDEKVALATARLATYAEKHAGMESLPEDPAKPRDPAPVHDLIRRYYSEVVEDEATLANASESVVGERFDAWIQEHRRAPAPKKVKKPNGRFLFCIMLEDESLENILALPEDPKKQPVEFRGGGSAQRTHPDGFGKGWVKVVTNQVWTAEIDKICGGRGNAGRYWLRVGVDYNLWATWFSSLDPDRLIEEAGWRDPDDDVQNLWGHYDDWYPDPREGTN